MQDFALELVQAGEVWPGPGIQQAGSLNEYIGCVRDDLESKQIIQCLPILYLLSDFE